jgi:cyclophilin family peptidyl-prolyl cis-trans isomerase
MDDVNRTPRLLLLLGAAALALSACGDDSTAGSSDTTTAGASATLDPACAKADGSSPKTQQFSSIPPTCIEEGKVYTATIETTKGTLRVTLRNDIAPITVNSFVNLARFHYFDGTTCHRAIQGFVVQCGDPTATGTGGPGYEIPDEFEQIEPYQIGSVAMANTGQPNTGGSQFFIITGPNGASLPPQYTLFGQVVADDMGVVQALDAIANPADGPPLEAIDITSVTITEG